MRRFFTVAGVFLLMTSTVSHADEGMWLPNLISGRIADMQSKGFKLSAEDIYSVNQASLKDAVILFGGGCTGELVSPEGLLLTNHHCGYSQIQRHSSVEHDYLRDGFWAMTRDEELPCPGLTVSFLERMEDVTSSVLNGWTEGMSESVRDSIIKENTALLEDSVSNASEGIEASVEPLYYGNQYFLFVYRIYRDVRLAGAPPSSIGKFGGDTDNWMWPRHTGDFSIFRIYADRDNKPSDYSESNVPYQPKRFFKISRKGVKEGDFTFIYGNPGSTREYITSEDVRWTGYVSDPERIAIRTLRLDIQKKHMAADQAVRIQYSAKSASVSNAWKKWQGESLGIRRMNTVQSKKDFENRFRNWASVRSCASVVERIDSLLCEQHPFDFAKMYYTETANQIELCTFASAFVKALSDSPDKAVSVAEKFFKDYYLPIDKESFVAVMQRFDERLDDSFKPEFFKDRLKEYASVQAWADDMFGRSIFTDREKLLKYSADDIGALKNDPAYQFDQAFKRWYFDEIQPSFNALAAQIKILYREYMKGQMDFAADRMLYPDANLTLRVAYGQVKGYSPADGVYYKPYSSLRGVMEKDNPDIFDYNIPQVLRDLYAKGDYPDVPVCFLATNHTTGGNSGSPVINADGDLIGINFDRVWEGTMSDIVFDPDYCRNISLDIRYLLFIVEKIGCASHLLKEMTFVD